ncbi:DUF4328 domain-containing protein [Streptomyces sp. CA-251387]|uniref:DUF4328 domain-containing protein n=1 Tax=Streptomyces sp. CA-251387 TaxID=3240064 RepID=UPI003D900CB9
MGRSPGAVVCAALGANIALAAAHLMAQLRLYTDLGRMAHGEPVLRAQMWVGNLSGVQTAAFVGTGLLFVGWFVQAWEHADVERLRPGRRWWRSRTWALAGWFVPAANLGIPLLLSLDMWSSARPRATARYRSPLWVVVWWVTFVSWTYVAGSAKSRYERAESADAIREALHAGIVADVLGALAGLAAIMFVWQLSRSLTSRESASSQAQGARTVPAPPALPS